MNFTKFYPIVLRIFVFCRHFHFTLNFLSAIKNKTFCFEETILKLLIKTICVLLFMCFFKKTTWNILWKIVIKKVISFYNRSIKTLSSIFHVKQQKVAFYCIYEICFCCFYCLRYLTSYRPITILSFMLLNNKSKFLLDSFILWSLNAYRVEND